MKQLTFEDLEPPGPLELKTPDELYDEADEQLLRQLIEDRRFEKKSARFNIRALGDYVCMWANTAPYGGLIAVGIRDDTILEGLGGVGLEHVNTIEKVPNTFCPDAVCSSKRISIKRDSDDNDDYILLIRVQYHKNRAVRTVAGDVFTRLGDSKILLNETQVRHLQSEKGEIRFEDESVSLDYPTEFNTQELDAFFHTVLETKGWDSEHTREDVLTLMHLGKRDGSHFIPNKACTLLFARDPQAVIPGARIRFLRFDGDSEGTGDKWNAVKDEVCDGTILEQLDSAAQLIRSQLRTFSVLGKGGKFYTTHEYPEPAWYEAIVNACAHRSYGNGLGNMMIFVKMFENRLVVESPGPFPPFVTPENIYEVSIPRNPFLMECLRYLAMVKAAHEGTRRMRDTMREHGLPEPEFEQAEVGGALVRVTLRNNANQRKMWVDADVASLLGEQAARKLSEHQKRFMKFVMEHGSINVSDAQRLTGLSWPAARKMLGKLVDMSILCHICNEELERDPTARFVLNRLGDEQS